MKYVNATPHAIMLNNGTSFNTSGTIARVTVSFEEVSAFPNGHTSGAGCIEAIDSGFCSQECIYAERKFRQVFGSVENLPEPSPGTVYIVSAMVLAALSCSRDDVVAPATGHPECIRNDKGQITSVPGFVLG